MTNRLLLGIAILLLAHLVLRFTDSPLGAETFRLDNCITARPGEKPGGYVHMVAHSLADVDSLE